MLPSFLIVCSSNAFAKRLGVVSHAGAGGSLLSDVPIADKAVNAVIACIIHHNARVNPAIVLSKKLLGM